MTKIARFLAKRHKSSRVKSERERDKLILQRNKALKEANEALAKAKAREDLADAEETKLKARARLRATKGENIAKKQLARGVKQLFGMAKDIYEERTKPKRRTKRKRK